MGIGTVSESSLHASLKEIYFRPGDKMEELVDGYIVDIVRGDDLIEIQTGNFASIKAKLAHLLRKRAVSLVHPIAASRWITRVGAEGDVVGRRRSPKRGKPFDAFEEFVTMPHLLLNPNLTVELLMVEDEVVYECDGGGKWRRRGMSKIGRRLISIEGRVVLSTLADFKNLLPKGLTDSFTAKDVARAVPCTISLARMATYTLKNLGAIEPSGSRGRATEYRLAWEERFVYDSNNRDAEDFDP
jgi:hypothetical protein